MPHYLRLSRRDILQRLFTSAKTPLLVLDNILHNYILDRGSDKLYKSIRIDGYLCANNRKLFYLDNYGECLVSVNYKTDTTL